MLRVESHGGGTFPVIVSSPIFGRNPWVGLPASTLWYVVHSPVAPWVASQQPPGREDESLDGAVDANGLESVGGAAGCVSTPGAEGRGDVALVGDDGCGHESAKRPARQVHRASHLRHARAITRSRCSPSSLEGTPRALCEALTTTRDPSGRSAIRSRMRWRSCRLTRLRPLARLISRLGTTKPTRRLLRSSSARTWTTTSGSPARVPCRIAAVKSAGSTMRCARGSTGVSQADSLARPLRRRAARMARPARVDMRRRKPCVLERRRLLGWKVRLVVTAILLGGEWFPTRYRLGYRHASTRDSGDARPKWAQTKTKTKRIGAARQRGNVTHRVTHSIHSCVNHCGSHPSTEGG